jgi:cell division protease FtsH
LLEEIAQEILSKEVIEGEQLQALLERVKPLDREPVTV